MARQSIDSLKPQMSVDEVYRLVDKQLRANRQGGTYLLLQLADRTGVISGMRWNATQFHYDSVQKGDFVQIKAMAQLHNGNMQLIVHDMDTVQPQRVDLSEFDALDRQQVERDWDELLGRIRGLQSEDLRELGLAFCLDPHIQAAYQLAPAGVKTHHAHPGGLLSHVVSLMRLVEAVAPNYPQIDRDLLMLGVFLHDIGKLEELAFDGELAYTDPGQLIGHLVQGVQMLDRKVAQLESSTGRIIPKSLQWRLQHMIVSHHGCLEHGSPKVPMTLEAILLHYLDDMDAKLNASMELIQSDLNADSHWTNFNPTLGRKIFKPSMR